MHSERVNGDHKWQGGPFTEINDNANTLIIDGYFVTLRCHGYVHLRKKPRSVSEELIEMGFTMTCELFMVNVTSDSHLCYSSVS